MKTSDMKNIVVLKNLPSNMVEEAIIILKESQRIREKELIDKGNKANSIEIQQKSKDYILKEAEMLVTDYINKIENRKKSERDRREITQKYKILKYYSIISTSILAISLIINFI